MSSQDKIDSNATSSSAVTTMSSNAGNSSVACNNNTEQPQTKRQKIEKTNKTNGKLSKNTSTATSSMTTKTATTATATPTTIATCKTINKTPPPDLIDTRDLLDTNGNANNNNNNNNNNNSHHLCSSLSSSSSHSISTPSSSSNNSPTSTPGNSRASSMAQLLSAQNLVNILPQVTKVSSTPSTITKNESNCCSSTNIRSNDEVDRVATLPDLLTITRTASIDITAPAATCTSAEDMREFEKSLTKQCLCGVSERTLRKPFQSHYSVDANGQKRIANLSEWPTNKLLQFLSNLQLLFDIYLKQNSKGFICARIMDVCDALIRNDHNLIDEIIVLAGYHNNYVQFLAGRVLAAFLVIAKQDMNDDWLKKIVDNLFNFERLDQVAVQKIHFSLEIIKRIVEWKDVELHPLEDEISSDIRGQGDVLASPTAPLATSTNFDTHANLHFPTQLPTLENNYFAVHFRTDDDATLNVDDVNEDDDDNDDNHHNDNVNLANRRLQQLNELNELYGYNNEATTTTSATNNLLSMNATNYHHQPHNHHNLQAAPTVNTQSSSSSASTHHLTSGCHIVTLTDSESFDTTHLKGITIKILENKWPALVKNMSALMSSSHLNIEHAEHCILNFLQLWENIISVKANLSIVETLPFYAQLDKFELLLNQNLSCTVYKQMLCLFNEALCYGSTLALQDMLPDETCKVAHQIVRHVKDYRILESLPRRQPENIVSLIGFKRQPIVYVNETLHSHVISDPLSVGEAIEMDKTILQKMVLLVLKSIAVTVKEIRSDSSDSSIDSTDYDAFQDMLLIERSIRDVLCKLESFIKHTLQFHPECHFSKILIHLFDDQDDHLIEAMVCTLDVTSGISFRNNAFPELVSMLNPVYTFLEFLKMTSNSSDLLLDLLVSNETCFLLYLLRFLKYIRMNWAMFVQSCHDFGMGTNTLDEAMSVLIRLRLQISRLVSRQLYPYDISPVLRLLESCESLYEGNELS